jgi:hypothetical protein
MKHDSVLIWPPAPSTPAWGHGSDPDAIVPIQRLNMHNKTARTWFAAMVKTTNVPANPAQQSEEVDMLFEDDEAKNARKRAVEDAIETANKVESESNKKIKAIGATPLVVPTAASRSVYEVRVQEWFNVYNKEGRAGNIGLVPGPLKALYPTKAPLELDPMIAAYVAHFAEWDKKK